MGSHDCVFLSKRQGIRARVIFDCCGCNQLNFLLKRNHKGGPCIIMSIEAARNQSCSRILILKYKTILNMSLVRKGSNALSRSSRCLRYAQFSSTASPSEPLEDPPVLDPHTVYTHKQERQLWRHYGKRPIGSRRKRVAMATNPGLPFEQLPYQCFQEARKVLSEHRTELLDQIKTHSEKINRLEEQKVNGQEALKNARAIGTLSKLVEKLVVEADSRDPVVLKTFEDGIGQFILIGSYLNFSDSNTGDMKKPIYRHLADQKWREYKRKIVLQRLNQMFVTPDVLPDIDPTASVELRFPRGTKVEPGQFVDSRISQFAPTVDVKVFNADSRLVTIVFVDSDVPNLETDDFDHRCHGIFTNISVDSRSRPLQLGSSEYEAAAIVPWLPPSAQRGSTYHRISVWVLEHDANRPLEPEEVKRWVRDAEQGVNGFNMRSFVAKSSLKPVGASMFRTQWDDGMFEIMKRYNIPGADVELKRRAPEKLPYKKKDPKRYR
jgi:large subunit ribosomal protein L35